VHLVETGEQGYKIIYWTSTYKEAFQQAEEYAQKEIPLLAEAIEKRMKALEKAEKSLENFYR